MGTIGIIKGKLNFNSIICGSLFTKNDSNWKQFISEQPLSPSGIFFFYLTIKVIYFIFSLIVF